LNAHLILKVSSGEAEIMTDSLDESENAPVESLNSEEENWF
jgi:hypothetical protein